jgi:hypothetical protein
MTRGVGPWAQPSGADSRSQDLSPRSFFREEGRIVRSIDNASGCTPPPWGRNTGALYRPDNPDLFARVSKPLETGS